MTEKSVLIIDDEPDIRELIELTLLRMGLKTYTAGTVQDALDSLQDIKPDLCLTDMKLPDGTGMDVVNYIQHHMPDMPVAVITAFGSMETAVEALKAGAYDFVSKPVDLKKLRGLVETALQLSEEEAQVNVAGANILNNPPSDDSTILGNSDVIRVLNNTIKKLAKGQAPVHIYGESGSGKELVAKNIHSNGTSASAPFIPVNCGAIPENLMESEFFGHKKGSFTGALTDKEGLFQAADGGTLFLDEVADLPLDMQVKLLRAIQERAIKPVGGTEEMSVNVRILSATHKSLENEITAGRFREDLYYRLNVIKLKVPPLRERGTDILLLTDYLLAKTTDKWQIDNILLSDEAKGALKQYTFPGNVRELVNILERAVTLCENGVITVEDLQLPAIRARAVETVNRDIVETQEQKVAEPVWEKGLNSVDEEKRIILAALNKTRWNRTKAAEELGMSFRQLRYRVKKYGLDKLESV